MKERYQAYTFGYQSCWLESEKGEMKSLVAVKPKPPFRPIFQVAATKEGSEIRILNEPLDSKPPGSSVFLVEAGEG